MHPSASQISFTVPGTKDDRTYKLKLVEGVYHYSNLSDFGDKGTVNSLLDFFMCKKFQSKFTVKCEVIDVKEDEDIFQVQVGHPLAEHTLTLKRLDKNWDWPPDVIQNPIKSPARQTNSPERQTNSPEDNPRSRRQVPESDSRESYTYKDAVEEILRNNGGSLRQQEVHSLLQVQPYNFTKQQVSAKSGCANAKKMGFEHDGQHGPEGVWSLAKKRQRSASSDGEYDDDEDDPDSTVAAARQLLGANREFSSEQFKNKLASSIIFR